MKKFVLALKIISITLSSLIALIIIAIAIVCNVIVTPKYITPIVRDNAPRVVTCQVGLDTADITFFSTFPQLCLKIDNATAVNPTVGAPSDTLLHVNRLYLSLDIKELISNFNVKVKGVELHGGEANIFMADSITNFDILALESDTTDTSSSFSINLIDVQYIDIKDVTARYCAPTSGIEAQINNLTAHGSAKYKPDDIFANLKLAADSLSAIYNDSTKIEVSINDVALSLKGNIQNADIEADVSLKSGGITTYLNGEQMTDRLPIEIELPLVCNYDTFEVHTKNALLNIDNNALTLNCDVETQGEDMLIDADIETAKWQIERILTLVPQSYKSLLDGIEISGDIALKVGANGVYNSSTLPLVDVTAKIENGKGSYREVLDYKATNIKTEINADLDLNPETPRIDVKIPLLKFNAASFDKTITADPIKLSLRGDIQDLLGRGAANIVANAQLPLKQVEPFVAPDIRLDGDAELELKATAALEDLTVLSSDKEMMAILRSKEFPLEKIKGAINLKYTNLDVIYNDSILVKDPSGELAISIPSASKSEVADMLFSGENMVVTMVDMADIHLQKPHFEAGLGDFRDTTKAVPLRGEFAIGELAGVYEDTIAFEIVSPVGKAQLYPAKRDKSNYDMSVNYSSTSIKANMGEEAKIKTGAISINTTTHYSPNKEILFLKYGPEMRVKFEQGDIYYAPLGENVIIPTIDFDFKQNHCLINSARLQVAKSDFTLSGEIFNMRRYIELEIAHSRELKKQRAEQMKQKMESRRPTTDLSAPRLATQIGDNSSLLKSNNAVESKGQTGSTNKKIARGTLKAKLNFISEQTDIDALLDLVSRLGDDEEAQAEQPVEQAKQTNRPPANPFKVPQNCDVLLNTTIKNARFNGNTINDIRGKITAKNGEVLLEQVGFTAEAAKMLLSGIYRPERRDNLFLGIDFHLLDIDIAKLIDFIPSIDTIVPMLKSFEGNAEFHFAAKTYLNGYYEPKLKTLHAAAALEGHDLVLLDGETFSTIAKYLLFNKKTRNLVDSLSVEVLIDNGEIVIYPFMLGIDKWQAVLSGRHNLDMNFDYHISLTKCPLPIRLGLNVRGNFDDLHFKLGKCQYKALYVPAKQTATDKEILDVMKLIQQSLKSTVNEEDTDDGGDVEK